MSNNLCEDHDDIKNQVSSPTDHQRRRDSISAQPAVKGDTQHLAQSEQAVALNLEPFVEAQEQLAKVTASTEPMHALNLKHRGEIAMVDLTREAKATDSLERDDSSLTASDASSQYEGGDGAIQNVNGIQNGHGANQQEGEGEAAEAARPRRPKKEQRKIPRYESASIDEEEFQDYFTNPIKRKEFDRQRKKQQMREMQNITGFTLGQFGIKSMKAMKEALPAYPDDDDMPNDGDSQKNYATVSLCCLSVTNPFRNKIIQIVSVNPWFDRFILFVILFNCLFLALDKEVDIVSNNMEVIDLVFLIIYTWEMTMKIIAMGFFMRAHSYLRDSWNIMDFSVVVLGWVSAIIDSGDISAIKVIRILRPLRTINQIPNMSSLVATILNSLPIMFDVMVLFLFMLIMFGTIATQLLGGHLEKRCVHTDKYGQKFTSFIQDEENDFICLEQSNCDEMKEEWGGLVTSCEYVGNPISDTYSFDNILLSIMNIFEMITLEGWTDMMYIVRDAEQTLVYDIFFLMCVIVGNFIILNLMVAVQSAYLDKAFDEEEARKQEIVDKIEAKRKLKQEIEEAQEYDDETESEEEENPEEFEEESEDGRGGRRGTRKKQVKKGICDIKQPAWIVNSSAKVNDLCETVIFERTIIGLILLNTLSLASEHYEESQIVTDINHIANLFFTIIFAVEMVLKLYGFGCKKYVADNFNNFDAFIVVMSYVELVVPQDDSGEGGGGLGMLRAFRLLRIFKIIKSWESLKVLLSTVFDSLQAITNLGVLIVLFLFIFALLCKQFFSEPLLDDGGEISRYSFGDTFTALITMFIILTGENWNEVMILVISNKKNLAPAYLFISMMLLGNFMLLNLFLAILLKSISDIGDEEDDAEQEQANNEEEENDNQGNLGGLNESAPLNSSNSNIEEEFEQIKAQLMALSNKMNAQLDGKLNQDDDAGSEANGIVDKKDNDKDQKDEFKSNQNNVVNNDEEDDLDKYKQQKSLLMFTYDNMFRSLLRDLISNSYFAGFIYHLIAFNSLLLALDMPQLTDPYQKKTINFLLETISIIFVVEFVIKVIVMGFYCGEKTYLKDPWNILDFIIVFFSIITWILEATATGDVSFLRGFRALRALRPLRVVSKNEGIKTVVNALLESIPALINVLLIVMLFLLVFGILGIQLFKGQLGVCNDDSEEVLNKQQCINTFLVPILDRFGQVIPITVQEADLQKVKYMTYDNDGDEIIVQAQDEDRQWSQPFNRYDTIFLSMMTFFEISTLEMWPDMMFAAIDARGYDLTPKAKNSKMVSLLYVVYIFVTTFFIMNLFISVIVDKFNEQIKKRQGSDNFSNEQKEWVKIQRLLVHTNPKIIPVEPINCFRLQCFRVVQSQAFEYLVMFAIIVNTLFLCIDYHQKSAELDKVLQDANLVFVVFFTVEMVIKITAYGWKYYWYVNWNKFDFVIVMLSLIAVDEELLESLNFNVTALRIMRVSRLFRMVKTSEGLRTLLKTLFMSMSNIFNTAALLTLILFTFSVAGMSLFGTVKGNEFVDDNVNFRSFYIAMMTLFRASTGESWNGIMHDCFDEEGIIAVFFWSIFQLMSFFIFMNVFIAVIGESFDDNQQTEDENDILALKKKDIKAFQNTWAKYNPMGELYMRTIRLPDFLRELPPPLGYQGIRIEESKLNKIIFCLNIRDHLGRVYYPEVMWTIFHSIAGMNDEKVLNCEQINNILKVVKHKYKGLGKKINLDTLCGNKYYRKELTAIKYIQAMKILTKWRNFKNQNKKNKDQVMMQQSVLSPGQTEDAPPRAQIYEAQDGDRNSNAMYLGGDRSHGKPQGQAEVKQQRLTNIRQQIDANRALNNAQSNPRQGQEIGGSEEDEDQYGDEQSDQYRNDGGDQDDSGDMDDMPVTERNQHTNRNQNRLGQYTRDQDASQAQARGNRGAIQKSGSDRRYN